MIFLKRYKNYIVKFYENQYSPPLYYCNASDFYINRVLYGWDYRIEYDPNVYCISQRIYRRRLFIEFDQDNVLLKFNYTTYNYHDDTREVIFSLTKKYNTYKGEITKLCPIEPSNKNLLYKSITIKFTLIGVIIVKHA